MKYLYKYIFIVIIYFSSSIAHCEEQINNIYTEEVIKTISCGNKKIKITNLIHKNEANSIRNKINGIFHEKWLAYTEAQYYGEVHEYYLINKNTCEKFKIEGQKFDFLNKNIFLTWSMDFGAEYYPNKISTYKIQNNKVIKTGEFSPPEGGPSKAKWVNNKTIKFILVNFNESSDADKEPYKYKKSIITKINNEWLIK